jgi:phage terminase small subunit
VVDWDADQVVAALVEAGTRRDLAVQYADAFAEYREASKNISEHGAIVQHPRTSNPIENPYLVVRDRALRKLQGMVNVKGSASLW